MWLCPFQVKRHFQPELLNRLDEIIVFVPLSHEQLLKVARMQMKNVAVHLAQHGVALAVIDAALQFVLMEFYDPICSFSNSPI
jgi:ATP-dependent Clp protease ATP-binding subunit ClpB